MTPRLITSLSALTLATVFGGCASTTTSPAKATASAYAGATSFPRDAMKELRLGMTQREVLALVGQPAEKEPASAANGEAETWRYFNTTDPVYRDVAIEMEEVAYVDPITGIARTILDPRPEMERITTRETFFLVFNQKGILADLDYDAVRSRER
ncbi:hypothetical protein [Synoicihabitans lomoniglobus]|uniref:Outer membrane protein assembly factor BamE n=1 Tax=Synoicihabitans lomoniglobus TaxID=2909285 RepID=A0AAE9ZXD5_9BACT|nr:hypothetical protein [Opitutaceae bacterium LMO-M01]WED64844.1 hypothetical protein PXH66_21065 [Opitutaceae bacterium LMO-M01]